jgi:hypothetical protein
MMIVMLAGMAAGGITWTRRHLNPRSGKPRSAGPGQSSSDRTPRTGSGGQAPLP